MATTATVPSAVMKAMVTQKPTFAQVMYRVKDPKASLAFYVGLLGFTLIHEWHLDKFKFSVYFLAHVPPGTTVPTPGTAAAETFLWTYPGCAIALTHNHGTAHGRGPQYHNGNDPIGDGKLRGGFGHIAVNTPDVYKLSAALEAKGCAFKKKPDEGRMKGLAFVYDPDRYWVEIVQRSTKYAYASIACNLSQCMLRVKDPKKTIPFYRDLFQMTLVRESHYGDFSLYFLASLTDAEKAAAPRPTDVAAKDFVKSLHNPVLELTHNHGTESKAGPVHHTGNVDPKGFGHVGFSVSDVYATTAELVKAGVPFHKLPDAGNMKGLAHALDPDGYRVEIIQRGWVPKL